MNRLQTKKERERRKEEEGVKLKIVLGALEASPLSLPPSPSLSLQSPIGSFGGSTFYSEDKKALLPRPPYLTHPLTIGIANFLIQGNKNST